MKDDVTLLDSENRNGNRNVRPPNLLTTNIQTGPDPDFRIRTQIQQEINTAENLTAKQVIQLENIRENIIDDIRETQFRRARERGDWGVRLEPDPNIEDILQSIPIYKLNTPLTRGQFVANYNSLTRDEKQNFWTRFTYDDKRVLRRDFGINM